MILLITCHGEICGPRGTEINYDCSLLKADIPGVTNKRRNIKVGSILIYCQKHKVSQVRKNHRSVQKSHEGAKNLTPNTANASTIVFEGFPCTAINHSSVFFLWAKAYEMTKKMF